MTKSPDHNLTDPRKVFAAASDHTRENFSVLSCFVPQDLREDFVTIYTFCRYADDLGDCYDADIPASRLRAKASLAELRDCVRTAKPGILPISFIQQLSLVRDKHNISLAPFLRLIDAFEQDQSITRYASWEELTDYSVRSANPVGHLVLMLFGYRPPEECNNNTRDLFLGSDDTCTALQLANFWQDVRRDLVERDRVYLPLTELNISEHDLRAWAQEPMPQVQSLHQGRDITVHPFCAGVRKLVQRTDDLFERGGKLFSELSDLAKRQPTGATVTLKRARACARVVRLFAAGGRLVNSKVRACNYTTLWKRPRVTRFDKLRLLLSHFR